MKTFPLFYFRMGDGDQPTPVFDRKIESVTFSYYKSGKLEKTQVCGLRERTAIQATLKLSPQFIFQANIYSKPRPVALFHKFKNESTASDDTKLQGFELDELQCVQ